MDTSPELKTAIEAVKSASSILLEFYKKETAGKIENKGKVDRVSDADLDSEKIIREILSRDFPEYNINGEEFGESNRDSEYMWYIDPLCGSIDFIHGFPDFGVSVALLKNEEIMLGVCALPAFGELFWAEKGKGAFQDGKKISVSKVDKIEDAVFTSHLSFKGKDLETSHTILKKLTGYYVKIPGSFPYMACNLARGRSDAHVEKNVSGVHSLAGTMIALEAGAKVSKIDGSPFSIHDEGILITNGLIHDDVVKLLA